MINSLLILCSTYNSEKNIKRFFIIGWFVYMLIGSNLMTNLTFTALNFISFILVVILGKVFRGSCSNKIVSILSILIWSIIIDIICYFLYPQFNGGNILIYVVNGLSFNYKYLFINILIIGTIALVEGLDKTKKKHTVAQLALINN
jgi:hypothetical protein